MKKMMVVLSFILIIFMLVPSLAVTGHINGCTNTGDPLECCVKTFNIKAKEGHRVIDVKINGESKGPITSYTFNDVSEAQNMEVITEPIIYNITTSVEGNGTINLSEPTAKYGENKDIIIIPNAGYKVSDVLVDDISVLTSLVDLGRNINRYTLNVNKEHVVKAIFEIDPDKMGTPNAPVIRKGEMVPVVWDQEVGKWKITKLDEWDYNYNSVAENKVIYKEVEEKNATNNVGGNGNGKWANVMTLDGLTYYEDGTSGTEKLLEVGTDIDSLAGKYIATQGSQYVWIPRYTYKIESGYRKFVVVEAPQYKSAIKSWNSDLVTETDEVLGKIVIKWSDGIKDDMSDGYITHPAFRFAGYMGGNPSADENYCGEITELTGIWVAKYEASGEFTYCSDFKEPNEYENASLKFVPGVRSVARYESGYSRDFDGMTAFTHLYYTYREADSHMIKNSEWGAVAYLTNAIGKIPYVNNDTYETGYAGGKEDDNAYAINSGASYASEETYAWNTNGGVKASTTHNVYGIYDMSGGSPELVSTSNIAPATKMPEEIIKKYMDIYPSFNTTDGVDYTGGIDVPYYTGDRFGDAMYETSFDVDFVGNLESYYFWNGNFSSSASWDAGMSQIGEGGINRGGYFHSYKLYGGGIFAFNATRDIVASRATLAIPLNEGITPNPPIPSEEVIPDSTIYTITTEVEGNGVITPSEATAKYGETREIILIPYNGYKLSDVLVDGVSVKNSLTDLGNGMNKYTLTVSKAHNVKAIFEEDTDPTGMGTPNAPVIRAGEMVPVKWSNVYNAWVTTTEFDPDWYNYKSVADNSVEGNKVIYDTVEDKSATNNVGGNGRGKWANVMTLDGLTYYENGNSGTKATPTVGIEIPAGKVIATQGSQYVWIPRYTYKIESGYRKSIESDKYPYHSAIKSWNSDLATETDEVLGKIVIKWSDGIKDNTSDGYIIHPAFRFGRYVEGYPGTDSSYEGDITELTGIWVAKYEASDVKEDVEVDIPGETYATRFIPDANHYIAYTNEVTYAGDYSFYNRYISAYNTYRSADSHLMKNTEWGAVAYLTNAIGRVPYTGVDERIVGGYKSRTGLSGDTQDSSSWGSTAGDSYSWKTNEGVKGSTTHNVYGIYGMSSGGKEVIAYCDEGMLNYEELEQLKEYDMKYLDTYRLIPYQANRFGDAMYETSAGVQVVDPSSGDSDISERAIESILGILSESWDNDGARVIAGYAGYSGRCYMTRGGTEGENNNRGVNAGIFCFYMNTNCEGASFRVTLAIPQT